VTNYRLYFMTCIGSHIDRFEVIEADSDTAAIEAAKLYQGPYPLELWQRDRRVEAFPRLLRPGLKPDLAVADRPFGELSAPFCTA
jgi:hypothetical protein